MTYLSLLRNPLRVAPIVLIFTASAMAEWKAANPEVAAAANERNRRYTGGRECNR